jgi:signal peptidase II
MRTPAQPIQRDSGQLGSFAKLHIKRTLTCLILALLISSLDQVTKIEAQTSFLEWSHPSDAAQYRASSTRVLSLGNSPSRLQDGHGDPGELSKNWLDFNLTYLRNPGAVWGVFSEMKPPFRKWFLSSLSVVIISGLLYYMSRLRNLSLSARTAFTLILAGAFGNLFDRLRLGYVIDWLHFEWNVFGWHYSFPVFNGADVFINLGMIFLLLGRIFSRKARCVLGDIACFFF